jgi:hypothetical protein
MKQNVGGTDRVLRVVLGLAIGYAGYTYHAWWGFLGLIPIAVAAVGFCPLYAPFGISTCKKEGEGKCGCCR